MNDTLEASLANCSRICFVSEPDYDKSKQMRSSSLIEHGGIQGDVKVFAVSDSDTFKSMDTKKPRSEALLTFHVVCQNRTRGDLKVTVLDSNEKVLATLSRAGNKSLFSCKESTKPISIQFPTNDGNFLARIVPAMAENKGSIECGDKTDTNKFGFSAHMPTWQASSKWILCAFVSFFPTFGIGAIVGFCMAQGSTLITSVKETKSSGETTKLEDAETKGDLTFVRLDGMTEAREKFGLILLFGYFAANNMAKPPTNHQV